MPDFVSVRMGLGISALPQPSQRQLVEQMAQGKRVFLSAEWRELVMLNYEVDAKLLEAHVPAGTVVDSFEGRTYVSLVGFRFCHTKLFGYDPIP